MCVYRKVMRATIIMDEVAKRKIAINFALIAIF